MTPNLHLWLIPVLPLAGAAINGLLGRRFTRQIVSAVALGFCGAAFAWALWVAFQFPSLISGPYKETLGSWIRAGDFRADFAFYLDQLSLVMLLVVTGVGFLIHIYSVGYMWEEGGYYRFFSYLNLFMFFMLTLVLADNYLLMFIGWEGVGLASYLLIGFWFTKDSAAAAGKKAFIVNRIGDFGFLIALFLLIKHLGSLNFDQVFLNVSRLSPETQGAGLLTSIALLLMIGACGKSAQIPLYVWLPDAMEGPTPVSALIHAATMVTAGVYMVARSHVIFDRAPLALMVVAIIGTLTAWFAATIGICQTDIKKVLAYSTISQIGYMFIGCGVGAYAAGIFHLMTHAFFKGLLFLAAGSVIHALSGEQDIRKMGGLRKHLPKTFPAFFTAALAISGIPFLSGFFSKDAILTSAYSGGFYLVWALGLAGAVMTAFYMFRLVFLTFFGQERMEGELLHHLHESPPVMTTPLIILAVLSVIGGYVGLPAVFGEKADLFRRFLEPVFGARPELPATAVEWDLILVSTAAAVGGLFVAYLFYIRYPGIPPGLAARWPRVYRLLVGKYYVDEFYEAAFVRPVVGGAEFVYNHFDLQVIDGALNGSAAAAGAAGRAVGGLQTGLIKDYALAFLTGCVLFLGFLLALKL